MKLFQHTQARMMLVNPEMDTNFNPRPAQKEILSYRNGTMGVSAVPGSGKTWTLSLLAAELIHNGLIASEQEILVVTLVNSAVSNFSSRISNFLEAYGRIPSLGYRVRTLHGLAHDIVKERPDLAGLDVNFQIIDELEAKRIRSESIYNWLKENKTVIDSYLLPDLNEGKVSSLHQKQIPDLLEQAALQFIRTAKNYLHTPESIIYSLGSHEGSLPLAHFGGEIFRVYQRNLEYRGAVDFDDLISYAYKVLNLDDTLLNRMQNKWPYILEDEAQDSSLMQQKILSLLSENSEGKNWVRVGDPNQAIYESFTTADPDLLISFIKSANYKYLMPNSGRSSVTILDLANQLVRWTTQEHPLMEARTALIPNFIEPSPPGDAQPNPDHKSGQVHLYDQSLSPDEELSLIAGSAAKWLKSHPQETAAILVPRNERGKKISAKLRGEFNIEPVELLNTSLATRKTTGAIVRILSYLLDPASSKKLSVVYKVWLRDLQKDSDNWNQVEVEASLIGNIKNTEAYITPGPAPDWLSTLNDQSDEVLSRFLEFSHFVSRWQQAFLLPIDQLILTIANDIFTSPDEMSLAHKMAVFIKGLSTLHPEWDLPILVDELKALARNERRFFLGGEDIQFDPDDHKGKVVVTTAHKAKGLEWDRVYLISANNYSFPSGTSDDKYIPEKWFIRDQLNLAAETLSQLSAAVLEPGKTYQEGRGTVSARHEYIRERLRLLYVAITRAKKELIITWNSGKKSNLKPAEPLAALISYFKQSQRP